MRNKQSSTTKFTKQHLEMTLFALLLVLPIAMYAALINSQNLMALIALLSMCVVMLILLIRR